MPIPNKNINGWTDETLRKARSLWHEGARQEFQAIIRKGMIRNGRYGVKVAQALVPVRTGELRESLRYDIETAKSGEISLTIGHPKFATREEAIKAYVAEFGRGHGPRGQFARGELPGRKYLYTSRILTRRRAHRTIRREMRRFAKRRLQT